MLLDYKNIEGDCVSSAGVREMNVHLTDEKAQSLLFHWNILYASMLFTSTSRVTYVPLVLVPSVFDPVIIFENYPTPVVPKITTSMLTRIGQVGRSVIVPVVVNAGLVAIRSVRVACRFVTVMNRDLKERTQRDLFGDLGARLVSLSVVGVVTRAVS